LESFNAGCRRKILSDHSQVYLGCYEKKWVSGFSIWLEFKLNWRRLSENRDRHTNLVLPVVDFFHSAIEIGERST
jgi:hypothetical protein